LSFLAPGWLALLAAVAALIVAYVLVQRRRSRYAVRFAALPLLERVMPREPGWRRHVPAAAFLLTITGLVLAMARPVLEVQVPRERATIVVAVDVSLSMGAQDVAPSRITAAVTAAREFVAELPETFPVGLVLFDGSSSVAVPPTPDRAAVTSAFDRISLGGGTAIGDAVRTSLEAVRSSDGGAEPPPARIVLLSDGANTTGTPIPAAAAEAAAAGVPVSTIAYGTPTGTATIDGESVRVPADVDALAGLAAGSGGHAYRAESAAELEAVYADIGSSIGFRTEEREVTGAVLALALLAALAAAAGSLAWFSRLP
jgi:Ca-activated chloride channel family protein